MEKLTTAALVDYRLPKIIGDWFWNMWDIYNKGMDPQVSDVFRRRPTKKGKVIKCSKYSWSFFW